MLICRLLPLGVSLSISCATTSHLYYIKRDDEVSTRRRRVLVHLALVGPTIVKLDTAPFLQCFEADHWKRRKNHHIIITSPQELTLLRKERPRKDDVTRPSFVSYR